MRGASRIFSLPDGSLARADARNPSGARPIPRGFAGPTVSGKLLVASGFAGRGELLPPGKSARGATTLGGSSSGKLGGPLEPRPRVLAQVHVGEPAQRAEDLLPPRGFDR